MSRPTWLGAITAAALLGAACGGVGARGPGTVAVKVLAINDFHGQLSGRHKALGRPVGGAPVLASYLKAAMAGQESSTILVEAGDLVGASPASSALLQDEPTIAFFSSFANPSCATMPPPDRQVPGTARFDVLFDPACNLVGVPGNHEFDEGTDELLRLLGGGNHPRGPFLDDPWRGARFPVISSNITTAGGATLFRPSVVKSIRGVHVAFIGATLQGTPSFVTPTGVAGLAFGDEAAAVNAQVRLLQAQGIHAFVVVIHDGDDGQARYAGPTDPDATGRGDHITSLVGRLDADVDVVVTAHAHAFANRLVMNAGGQEVLVTQAHFAGGAYADIDLAVDVATQDVVAKTARIVDTFADAGPGLRPDAATATLVAAAESRVARLVSTPVTTTSAVIGRTQVAGESPLGDLVADAQRAAMAANLAITNQGGLRADLPASCAAPGACAVTWNDCFGAQPFMNAVMKVTITGQQLARVLEQQWTAAGTPRILQISGFTYRWSASAAPGGRVVPGSLRLADGTAIDPAGRYTLALNAYLQRGGDGFTALGATSGAVAGPSDVDALVTWLRAQTAPVAPPAGGRVVAVP